MLGGDKRFNLFIRQRLPHNGLRRAPLGEDGTKNI